MFVLLLLVFSSPFSKRLIVKSSITLSVQNLHFNNTSINGSVQENRTDLILMTGFSGVEDLVSHLCILV